MNSILEAGAARFAEFGYPSVKMEDISNACRIKKSTLYHYFPTKDDLLYAIIDEHMDNVLNGIEEVVSRKGSPEDTFLKLLEVYTLKSSESRRRHIVSINDLKFLPPKYQRGLLERQKRVVTCIANALHRLNVAYPRELLKFYAMLLIGMLNWTDVWYRSSGPVIPSELCERIARLFITEFQPHQSGGDSAGLTRFLMAASAKDSTVTLSFGQISMLTNEPLPDAALSSSLWWTDGRLNGSCLLVECWRNAGFEIDMVRPGSKSGSVRFRRTAALNTHGR
ncbi:TetR family transcriptional regulator [Bradyrhizobium manausense]|uniref:TetR/AcrR family transcriptional regulator n=1 Tax=Bradyrhizobium manausense TaxID=989370 RepID=UPI001BAA8639|nr:TetR family transcriptional regulator [Bradyrhizobium manausense]